MKIKSLCLINLIITVCLSIANEITDINNKDRNINNNNNQFSLFDIDPSSSPTSLPTYSSSASYTQYSDKLRINFDVTLPSWVYYETYCLDLPTTYKFNTTYFESSLFDTQRDLNLADFQVYFSPTSEYIGGDYGQFASRKLADWPESYMRSSQVAIESGLISIDLSEGFNQICFVNNCGGYNYDCGINDIKYPPYNEFVGYIDLYGISIYPTVSNNFIPYYNWRSISPAVESTWRAICSSSSGQYIYAAALFGYIYSSDDYSETFSLSYENKQQWRDIATTASGDIVVAAVYDGMIYSYSAETGWIIIVEESNKWTGVSISGSTSYVYLSAYRSYLYRYLTTSETFTQANVDVSDWVDITSSDNGFSYAVAKNGFIWKENNGVWSVSYSLKRRWSAVSTNVIGTYIFASAASDQIYLSSDNGQNWAMSYANINLWSSISVNDDGIVYACDKLGRVYRSNGGNDWTKVLKLKSSGLTISVSNNDIAYVAAYDDKIYTHQIISWTESPTFSPSVNPTTFPTIHPTNLPSKDPTVNPTSFSPTISSSPTLSPTRSVTWISISNTDFSPNTIISYSSITVSDCKIACQSTSSCVAIVYYSSSSSCSLKSSLVATSLSSAVTAYAIRGSNLITNFDCGGNDLSYYGGGISQSDCYNYCLTNSACAGSNWNFVNGECYTKYSLTGSSVNSSYWHTLV